MDIAAGLTLVGQALGIVKDLREIDKGYDAAVIKAQMADLYSTLGDVKMALSDAKVSIHERDTTIRELQAKIATMATGEACPICGQGILKVTAVYAHPEFGVVGVQERVLKCTECSHTEKRMHDPVGALKGGR
ncbi:MAG TPA: hypothetical protein VGN79_14385 [Devosia sp.]|nr:hypothetical protein [Devosia sp.]